MTFSCLEVKKLKIEKLTRNRTTGGKILIQGVFVCTNRMKCRAHMTYISAFLGVITTTFSTTVTSAVSVHDLQFLRLGRFTIRSSSKLN